MSQDGWIVAKMLHFNTLKTFIIWQSSVEVNLSVLIGSFLVGIFAFQTVSMS